MPVSSFTSSTMRGQRQAGEAMGELLGRDLVADLAEHLGFHMGGDDLGIDEHAVAVEDGEGKRRAWESPEVHREVARRR